MPIASASVAATPAHWHGVDLCWAYAELLRGIQRRTGCLHRAYDVLHDSLVRLALVDASRPIQEPQIYLRRIVHNALVDQFREDSRWAQLPEDAPDAEDAIQSGESTDFTPSTERLADLNQRLRAVQYLLDCLPPRCREVFVLFRVEGYNQREIADRLGISLRMVERHMTRALVDFMAAREALLA